MISHRPGLAPWQLRAWLAVVCVLLVATWTGLLVGSVPAAESEPLPPWVMEGAVLVLTPYPLRVSGPDGEPWYVVRWSWRDVVAECVLAGPFAERDAHVLIAILTARMAGQVGE